jgi:hypothetical protein
MLLADQSVQCWGLNNQGQLGDQSSSNRASPIPVTGTTGVLPLKRVKALALGASTTCALFQNGTMKCWGYGFYGELGNGRTLPQKTPTSVVASLCQIDEDGGLGGYQCGLFTSSFNDSNFHEVTELSFSSDPKLVRFAATSDSGGNTAVAWIQKSPSIANSACARETSSLPRTINCDYRLYAAVRTAAGSWQGPTQIDSDYTGLSARTTLYQDAYASSPNGDGTALGGTEYASPTLAAVGEGQFLIPYVILNTQALSSELRVRSYRVGTGWSATSTLLSQGTYTSDYAFRHVNELKIFGNPTAKSAILLGQKFTTSSADDYGIYGWVYSSTSGWGTAGKLHPGLGCDPLVSSCAHPAFQGVMLDTGEAIVVFPAHSVTDTDGTGDLLLHQIGYR